MITVIEPGSTIGVLGSGQLGRMFTISARRMGYRVHVLSPEKETPTGQVADLEVQASYDDLDAIKEFAQRVNVVTFEFENIPAATITAVDQVSPVHPAGSVLHTTQHRLREKTFLQSTGIPVTPFRAVRTLAELTALSDDHFPGILKTAAWGYDGKGQVKIDSKAQAESAWNSLSTDEAVLERFVDFEREVSMVAARGEGGEFAHYGLFDNTHSHHILDLSVSPSSVSPQVSAAAVEITRTILNALHYVGVLCVEFFVTKGGELLVNELAPRPHNSGHSTIEAHATCQFEQQVRAVCGLPLGSTKQVRPAAMVNLLGDLWEFGAPRWERALALPDVKLHLYGKQQARAGRKMGHLTALAESPEMAMEVALAARDRACTAREGFLRSEK
ncbi:MAG: 5-(carboxyamino)imidazole ribonucleotide synthase [Planctomycetaceae bacterium]